MALQESSLWVNQLVKRHGTREPWMDRAGIPKGWVINGKLSEQDQEIVNEYGLLPVMPKEGFAGALSLAARVAKKRLDKAKEDYGENVSMIAINDRSTLYLYIVCPILLSDLNKDANTLIFENSNLMDLKKYQQAAMRNNAYFVKTRMASGANIIQT